MSEAKEKQFLGQSQQGPTITGQELMFNKRIKQSHILLPEKLFMKCRIIIKLVPLSKPFNISFKLFKLY